MTIDGCAEGYGPSVLVPTPDFNFTGIANSTGIIYYDTYSGGENNIFGADDYLSSIQINAIGTVNTYGPNTYAFVMGPQFYPQNTVGHRGDGSGQHGRRDFLSGFCCLNRVWNGF